MQYLIVAASAVARRSGPPAEPVVQQRCLLCTQLPHGLHALQVPWAGSSGIRECAELAGKLRADRHTSHEVETSVGAPAQLLQSLESRGEVQGMRKLSLFQRKQLPPKLKGRAMQIQALGEPLLLCWQHFMNKGLEIHLKIENYLKVNLAPRRSFMLRGPSWPCLHSLRRSSRNWPSGSASCTDSCGSTSKESTSQTSRKCIFFCIRVS